MKNSPIRRDPLILRIILITLVVIIFFLFVFLPLGVVLHEGFSKGAEVYFKSIVDPAALSAIVLTLSVAAWAVPLNGIFGLAAAWLIAKFQFKGKSFLTTLIDIPFSVSPVVVGLVLVLFLGSRSVVGGWLGDLGIKIIFSFPGMVLATVFVTFPFVARELIPIMEAQGKEEEEAAVTLGAGGWKMFWTVTLPNIRWALIYGLILCSARAIGEFGAVSVVSGHIRGLTNTIPLHVEILYNEYNFAAAYAVSSLLVLIAGVTLSLKTWADYHKKESLKQALENQNEH